jgi:hypothetical protein
VFALARQLIRDVWPSFFVAALWAVHPVLTESVTNIVGRADLLAAIALLSGLLIYTTEERRNRGTAALVMARGTRGSVGGHRARLPLRTHAVFPLPGGKLLREGAAAVPPLTSRQE